MQLLAREELDRLVRVNEGPCVSVYLPTHRAGQDIRQDPIRLKNLLKKAQDALEERGMRPPEAKRFLREAHALLEDTEFWRHQADGLALFAAPDFFARYRLPVEFREIARVNDRFYVKPLLRYFVADGRFFVLALSQKQVRLLEGTRHAIRQMRLDGPTSLEEALWHDEPEKQVRGHAPGGPPAVSGGRGGMIFHGQGLDQEWEKDRIRRFFRYVEEGVHEILRNEHAPCVLAGVEYLHPLYREANRYPYLLDEGLTGNFDEASDEELHAQAWGVVEPHLRRDLEEALASYGNAYAAERASSDLGRILRAAVQGRVGRLFLATGAETWGRFSLEKGTVQFTAPEDEGAEELLDRAAVETLLHAGVVHPLPRERMPAPSDAAALFRY